MTPVLVGARPGDQPQAPPEVLRCPEPHVGPGPCHACGWKPVRQVGEKRAAQRFRNRARKLAPAT